MIGFEGSPINGVKILTKHSLISADNNSYLEFLGWEGRQTAGSRSDGRDNNYQRGIISGQARILGNAYGLRRADSGRL